MLFHMPTLLHLDHTENKNEIGQMLETIVGVLKIYVDIWSRLDIRTRIKELQSFCAKFRKLFE